MAIDAVEKATAELMGYLTYEGQSRGIEVEDLLDSLVELLNAYQTRKNS